ncbi:MAG: extracellular solute-binding protein [Treponema sp.]|jgi:multiple sugar transport system substrate-binding protein|nr:extracellular solute-binding protein [Treponema sp.]
MKKAFWLLCAAALVIAAFGGCDKSKGAGGKPTLTVGVFAQEHEQVMYREVLKKFEQENNVSVDFQVAGDQYWPELEAALTANTAPDVFYLGIPDIKRRVWAGKVEALDGLLDTALLDVVWKDSLDLYRYDAASNTLGTGSIYALPKDFSAVSMTVNKAILAKRKAQIDALVKDRTLPFPPEIDAQGNLPVYTFSEFAALCRALTFDDPTLPATAGSTKVYGTHLWEDFCLQPFVWGAGGDYLDASHTKALFDSPAFIEGYEGFMKIVEEGGSGSSTDETSGYLKFLAGRVAYFPCGTWDVGAFEAIEKDEAVNPGKAWFDFDLAPWPISDRYKGLSIAERQDKWAGRVDSVGYAVSTQSTQKELAAKLAYALCADEEVQRFLAKQGGQVPNIVAMAEGEYLSDPVYFPETRKVFVNMLSGQNGRRIPTTYTFNSLWYSDAFLPGLGGVWAYYEKINNGNPPVSVSAYCKSIAPKAQTLLDESFADEAGLRP